MHVTVTVKAQAESADELQHYLGAQVAVLKEHFDALHTEGVFGDPAKCEVRYLVIGGGFIEPGQAERVSGTPSVE